MKIAFSSKLATYLTYRSLRFVSFPTQVLGKSCKAIPIMLMSALYGKKYKLTEWLSIFVCASRCFALNSLTYLCC